MSLEKHYLYFATDKKTKEELCNRYENEIAEKRKALFYNLLSSTGAIAVQEKYLNSSFICGLVFNEDHEHSLNKNLICKKSVFNGKNVISVTGKKNCAEGKAFNKLISDFNDKASEFLNFIDWMEKELGIKHEATTPSTKSPSRFSLISTYGGVAGDVLAFAIPKPNIDKLSIHKSLKEISYGQFYDLLN